MSILARRKAIARVAFNMRPAKGPWGGSSQFIEQMAAYLSRRGYGVGFDLSGNIDVIVLIDPRADSRLKSFGPAEIAAYRQRHPQARVLHRVNECDQRKGTAFMDPMLAEANRLADSTVFISEWLRDYHVKRWFDASRPHRAIYNGADPSIYHPVGGRAFHPGEIMRLTTHHWSDNTLKGFDVYERIDDLLARGELPGFELWVIGRWPAGLKWKMARTFPPSSGHDLAAKLRDCHVYVTASRWEPCGMHHVEGAQCGLPLVYHEDGGGIVEAGLKYGIGFRDDIKSALLTARRDYDCLRRRVLDQMPDGEKMCWEYERIIRHLVLSARHETPRQ
jgi:glycosyltransferase involved in cell wall biosynthesis